MTTETFACVYEFPIDHGLGFGYCVYIDKTSLSSFNGRLLYILNLKRENKVEQIELDKITETPVLFGPICINKKPNSKGKGAWRYLGETKAFINDKPIFKDINRMLPNYENWDTLSGWHLIENFEKVNSTYNHAQVRIHELPVIYGMHGVEIRTAMTYLHLQKKTIADYYDFSDLLLKYNYTRMMNTTF